MDLFVFFGLLIGAFLTSKLWHVTSCLSLASDLVCSQVLCSDSLQNPDHDPKRAGWGGLVEPPRPWEVRGVPALSVGAAGVSHRMLPDPVL